MSYFSGKGVTVIYFRSRIIAVLVYVEYTSWRWSLEVLKVLSHDVNTKFSTEKQFALN